ncbi:hypothetical protein FOL46_008987 [Perkinsus olseni]|uniref:Myb-like domain-containing protein n=1 Tax=Perkinsus olseni TaxID=32597 RepID=A0A7J6L2P9_PEROL|nr:hypothetical protein FOL46_008987 [Perkinsus olseni]
MTAPSSTSSEVGSTQQQQNGRKRGRPRNDKAGGGQRNNKRKKQSAKSSENGGSPNVGSSEAGGSSPSVGRGVMDFDVAAAMAEERTNKLDRYFGLACSMYFGSDGSSGSKNPFKDLCYRYVMDDPDEPDTEDPPGKEFDRALLNLYKQKSKVSSGRTRLPNRDYNRSFSTLALLTSACRQPEVIDCWGPYEIAVFETALARYGLNGWSEISREIATKTAGECEEFFRRVYSRTERGRIFTEVLLLSETNAPSYTPPQSAAESETVTPTPSVSGEAAKSTEKSSETPGEKVLTLVIDSFGHYVELNLGDSEIENHWASLDLLQSRCLQRDDSLQRDDTTMDEVDGSGTGFKFLVEHMPATAILVSCGMLCVLFYYAFVSALLRDGTLLPERSYKSHSFVSIVDLHSSIAAAVSNYVPTSFLEEIVLRFHDGSSTTADILSRQRERLAKLKDCVFVFDEDESSRGDLREDLLGGWQGKYNAYLRRVRSPLEPAPSSAQARDDLDNVILPSGVIRTLEEMRSLNVKPTVFAWMPLGVSSVDADALAWTK